MRTDRLAAALIALLAACGVETDDRPATVQYLVPAIFRPSCATAACHSAATARGGLVLDTIEGPCGYGPVSGFLRDDGGIATESGNRVRMPFDSPLPEADIRLIETWEADGLTGCP